MTKPVRKQKQVRFYPILPRTPRSKRGDSSSAVVSEVSDINYPRKMYADWVFLASGTKIDFINESRTVVLGQNGRLIIRHPGWRNAIAKGVGACYPYARQLGSCVPTHYSGFATDKKNYSSTCYGQIHGGGLIQPASYTPLIDEAVGKLKNKLNGKIGNAQLAAPLAESREIHRLIRQINGLGMTTLKSVLAIKKSRGKSAAKLFGDVWLGYGFGIAPMLKDIESAAKSILAYNTRGDHHVRVVGTATRDFVSGQKFYPEVVAYGGTVQFTAQCNHTQGVQIVAGINLKTRSAASYSVLDHLGLRISEVPSTLWELTPYSWAVDYFTTVSPWLDDMFFTLPGETVYVSQAKKYQSETTSTPEWLADTGFSFSASGNPSKFKFVSFDRSCLSALPTRSLRVKSVDEIAAHGITKLLNLASVIAGRRGPRL
jgi:hypothetical protein